MQLQSGLIRAGRCHKFWVKLKSTLDYFHPTTKSCFSPSSFRDLFSSISFTKPTLILLHQQQRRVHDSMRLKMFNAKLFSNTLTRDLILSRPSTKFLKNQTDIHTFRRMVPVNPILIFIISLFIGTLNPCPSKHFDFLAFWLDPIDVESCYVPDV